MASGETPGNGWQLEYIRTVVSMFGDLKEAIERHERLDKEAFDSIHVRLSEANTRLTKLETRLAIYLGLAAGLFGLLTTVGRWIPYLLGWGR